MIYDSSTILLTQYVLVTQYNAYLLCVIYDKVIL